jgi:starch-binding outer membrane protein SusE/F
MKKVILIFSVFVAIFLMIACEKDMDNPVLDTGQSTPPTVQSPADGTTFELLQVNEMDSVELFSWSAAQFNVENLPDIRYSMQVDLAGNDFANPVNLFTTTATSRQYTVAGLNMALISAGLPLGATSTIEARIFARVSDASEYDNLYSTPITLTVTTYEVMVKPIYLLGSGTTVGWSNTDALEMAHLAESRFARVEHLEPGEEQFIKFISVLGQWAPQWGSDESATPESGPLIYRPTEDVPDPLPIPVGEVAGAYYIEADTANLTYSTFLTSGNLYLVGDATPAGWDNTTGIPFEQETPHVFTLTVDLTAGGELKFLEVPGEWAPQWGTNDAGTEESGKLVYRPDDSFDDPANIPAPGADGSYLITVDLTTMRYSIDPQ